MVYPLEPIYVFSVLGIMSVVDFFSFIFLLFLAAMAARILYICGFIINNRENVLYIIVNINTNKSQKTLCIIYKRWIYLKHFVLYPNMKQHY